ncbi:24303_t:CDS:2, partial [Racocetra persica]
KSEYMKERVGKLLGWKTKDIEILKRKTVWQIPFSEEPRLFGVKEPFPLIKNSVCLFSEENECEEVRERRKVAKK